jgi:hypothetical protein
MNLEIGGRDLFKNARPKSVSHLQRDPWTPGYQGKGFVHPDGSVETWNLDDHWGYPHHPDMWGHPSESDESADLVIDPDGFVQPLTNEKGPPMQINPEWLKAHHPQLHMDEEQYHFGSAKYSSIRSSQELPDVNWTGPMEPGWLSLYYDDEKNQIYTGHQDIHHRELGDYFGILHPNDPTYSPRNGMLSGTWHPKAGINWTKQKWSGEHDAAVERAIENHLGDTDFADYHFGAWNEGEGEREPEFPHHLLENAPNAHWADSAYGEQFWHDASWPVMANDDELEIGPWGHFHSDVKWQNQHDKHPGRIYPRTGGPGEDDARFLWFGPGTWEPGWDRQDFRFGAERGYQVHEVDTTQVPDFYGFRWKNERRPVVQRGTDVYIGTPGSHHQEVRDAVGIGYDEPWEGYGVRDSQGGYGSNARDYQELSDPEAEAALDNYFGIKRPSGDEDYRFGSHFQRRGMTNTKPTVEEVPGVPEYREGFNVRDMDKRRPWVHVHDTNKVYLGEPGSFHQEIYLRRPDIGSRDPRNQDEGYAMLDTGEVTPFTDHPAPEALDAVREHLGLREPEDFHFGGAEEKTPPYYDPRESTQPYKGLKLNNGETFTWKTDEDGSPYHPDVISDLGIDPFRVDEWYESDYNPLPQSNEYHFGASDFSVVPSMVTPDPDSHLWGRRLTWLYDPDARTFYEAQGGGVHHTHLMEEFGNRLNEYVTHQEVPGHPGEMDPIPGAKHVLKGWVDHTPSRWAGDVVDYWGRWNEPEDTPPWAQEALDFMRERHGIEPEKKEEFKFGAAEDWKIEHPLRGTEDDYGREDSEEWPFLFHPERKHILIGPEGSHHADMMYAPMMQQEGYKDAADAAKAGVYNPGSWVAGRIATDGEVNGFLQYHPYSQIPDEVSEAVRNELGLKPEEYEKYHFGNDTTDWGLAEPTVTRHEPRGFQHDPSRRVPFVYGIHTDDPNDIHLYMGYPGSYHDDITDRGRTNMFGEEEEPPYEPGTFDENKVPIWGAGAVKGPQLSYGDKGETEFFQGWWPTHGRDEYWEPDPNYPEPQYESDNLRNISEKAVREHLTNDPEYAQTYGLEPWENYHFGRLPQGFQVNVNQASTDQSHGNNGPGVHAFFYDLETNTAHYGPSHLAVAQRVKGDKFWDFFSEAPYGWVRTNLGKTITGRDPASHELVRWGNTNSLDAGKRDAVDQALRDHFDLPPVENSKEEFRFGTMVTGDDMIEQGLASGWKPGGPGKGLMTPEGTIYHWPTEELIDGHPYHEDVEDWLRTRGQVSHVPLRARRYFNIDPNGQVVLPELQWARPDPEAKKDRQTIQNHLGDESEEFHFGSVA